VPSVPIGLRPGAVRDLDEIVLESANVRQDSKAIDQRLLDNFDPDTCATVSCACVLGFPIRTRHTDLKAKLANSTEAELKSLQFSLRSSKDDTAVELQQDVFKLKCVRFHSFNFANFATAMLSSSLCPKKFQSLRMSCSSSKVFLNGSQCPAFCTSTNLPLHSRVLHTRTLYIYHCANIYSSGLCTTHIRSRVHPGVKV
jgi:hypothetical protein